MDKFVYTLRKLPRFEVKLGRLGCVGGEFVQKRVDIALAVDLVRLSCERIIGKAVVVTGDSDFVPAIEAAKDAGVLMVLYYSPSSIHDELLSAVDECRIIDQELISKVAQLAESRKHRLGQISLFAGRFWQRCLSAGFLSSDPAAILPGPGRDPACIWRAHPPRNPAMPLG